MPARSAASSSAAQTRSPVEILSTLTSTSGSTIDEAAVRGAYTQLLALTSDNALAGKGREETSSLDEELEALAAIFGDQFKRDAPGVVDLSLGTLEGLAAPARLRILLFHYPTEVRSVT